ncbi:hypothetical protein ACQR0V_00680 [Bradyrhizobium sp. HKCCYLS2058]|uniref:hypothetical protein n=1 Tax=Bradyrhizobium TaxID=374 RepID=UPI003EBF0DE9
MAAAPQPNQIGLVAVQRDENEEQSKDPENRGPDTSKHVCSRSSQGKDGHCVTITFRPRQQQNRVCTKSANKS